MRPDRVARHDDLVAGRQDADPRPAMHEQPGPVHRRGEADMTRRESVARLQQHVALGEIEPGAADITALLRAFSHLDPVAVAIGVLLDDVRYGAGLQWSVGEEAHSLS